MRYNTGMKSVVFCFLLSAAGLWAQSTAKLDADLMSLASASASRAAVVPRIADDILALADKDARSIGCSFWARKFTARKIWASV